MRSSPCLWTMGSMTRLPPWHLFFVPESAQIDDDGLANRVGKIIRFNPGLVGRPFFVSSVGEPHRALNMFFASGRMRQRTISTSRKYAHALRLWVTFLAANGKDWTEAKENDVLNYKYWRRTDENNPRPVTGAAWSADAVAILLFHDWAHSYLKGPELTVSLRSAIPLRHDRLSLRGGDLRPSTTRRADVKWFAPAAVERWRDVGIHGISLEGTEKTRWRPRSQWRDAAFVDGLYGSGLRLQEWSSVLLLEMREPGEQRYSTHRVADACSKNQRGHSYWLRRHVLEAIAGYVESDREEAIRRARDSGAYESLGDAWFIDSPEPSPSGGLKIRRQDGSAQRLVRVNDLSPAMRRKLFVLTPSGPEPALLWLNENGSPRPQHAWYKTFNRANERVLRAGIDRMRCHPHMLRHSFALKWYAVGRLIWERRAREANERYLQDFREQFGDTWMLVQTMLGHASVETTKSVYLEPFRTLDVKALLEYGQSELDADLLLTILSDDPRVRLGEEPGGSRW